jgi:tetratricopeptide (TPR) repeat protein
MTRKSVAFIASMFLLLTSAVSLAQTANAQPENPATAVLPLTTKSAEAHALIDQAWKLNLDEVEQAQAIVVLQKAVKLDPDFALGHELLAQVSLEPSEQVAEQQKAFLTRMHASPAEQTLIQWFQDATDHRTIAAITEMNEVLSQYPHDKWVVFLATWWLMSQTQYERAVAVYEHSGINDSPGLMNNMGYVYAYMGKFDKAFALMDKYVAAMPDSANPQDSYAEMLRMAGRFDQSIEHYRAALSINPDFYASQFGIADTYSLMGDQVRARREYAIGFQKFSIPELHRIQWRTREAATYVREADYQGADHAFQAIADSAHQKSMSQLEADAYRQMAMYQQNPKDALALLDKADAANREGNNSWQTATAQEAAQILRARVETTVKMGNRKLMSASLDKLGNLSHRSNDKMIDTAYHGAAGAALFSEHKYKEAIPHLEEDEDNPLSLKLLAVAYDKAGEHADAKSVNDTLADLNAPTLEQALVVPTFRRCYRDGACSTRSASLK